MEVLGNPFLPSFFLSIIIRGRCSICRYNSQLTEGSLWDVANFLVFLLALLKMEWLFLTGQSTFWCRKGFGYTRNMQKA